MRKISPSLVITIAALWACSVHATPDQGSHRFDKQSSDTGLLTQINQARQSVSLRASELVSGAMSFIGVPYQRGGSSADTGFDCSGFVRSVYAQSIGLLLPRKAEEQASATQHIGKNELRPGDLVFFNTMRRAFSHVGIYVGNGKFIHSPKPGSEVRIDSMALDYWQNRFDGARRVPAVGSAQPLMATSLAALNDDAGPGTGLSIGTYTGADANAGANVNTSADSSTAARADTGTRTATNAGIASSERPAKVEKLKPAQAKKPEAKKGGLKKEDAKKQASKKQASKKQEAKKQEAKKPQTKKRESAKHASAPAASKAKKRAKA